MGLHHLSVRRMLCQVVNISCTTCEKFHLIFRKGSCAMSASFWEEQGRRQVPVQINPWCFQLAGSQPLLTGHTREHLIALPRHPICLDPACTVRVLSHSSEIQCSWLLLTLLNASMLKIGAPVMLLGGMDTGSLLWHLGKAFIKCGLKSTFHYSGFGGAKDRLQESMLDLNHYLPSSVWSTTCR